MEAKYVINNSFLSKLLTPDVTDISYNGKEIFYLSNIYGRRKYDKTISNEEVYIFLRKLSDYSNVPFSLANPILDLTIDKYRINATFESISKKNKRNGVTFSIRIASEKLKIKDDETFVPSFVLDFLKNALKIRSNILISGPTSSGKTELQKYLLSLLEENTRVVIIDTINELDYEYENKIDTSYLILEKNSNCSMNDLLETSLRYNPDYVVIAEARGKEFEYVITSALTGISTITTVHASSVLKTIDRCINMMQIGNNKTSYDILKQTLLSTFDVIIQLNIEFSENGIVRTISEVGYIHENRIVCIKRENFTKRIFDEAWEYIKERKYEK